MLPTAHHLLSSCKAHLACRPGLHTVLERGLGSYAELVQMLLDPCRSSCAPGPRHVPAAHGRAAVRCTDGTWVTQAEWAAQPRHLQGEIQVAAGSVCHQHPFWHS